MTEKKKMSKDTKAAWDGYNHILDIMQEGLKQGIDQAVEDFRDPNGVWSTAKDANDYANKLAAKNKLQHQRSKQTHES